ncbi:MAG: energy transducer TonB [Bryobacteraceae bacterium]
MCPRFGERAWVGAIALTLLVFAGVCRADDSKKEQGKDPVPVEVFEPGPNVKAPKLIHYVEPEFSPNSKEAFVEGVVKVSTVVTTDGTVSTCQIVRGLNSEEDRTALKAVKLWRFQPGTKEGKPVNVRVTVEIEFHLM